MRIEKHIPIPKSNRVGEIDYVGLIHGMTKGESFVVPMSKRAGALSAFRRHKIKCTTRIVDDELVRIWRTE
jgi:hypothetical protein